MEQEKKKSGRILLSFIHPVAVMLSDTTIMTTAAVCEEIFGAKTEVTELDAPKPKFWKRSSPIAAPLDFPLYVKVISLGDGKPLAKTNKMIVKYNNISAIMELE